VPQIFVTRIVNVSVIAKPGQNNNLNNFKNHLNVDLKKKMGDDSHHNNTNIEPTLV
jgi:hypothetical protein